MGWGGVRKKLICFGSGWEWVGFLPISRATRDKRDKGMLHDVVCFKYKFVGGELQIKVLDNHYTSGPRGGWRFMTPSTPSLRWLWTL